MVKAKQHHCMTANETRNFAISYASMLGSGIALTGTPTITADPASVTLSNKVVSVSTLTINGESVAAGEAVQFAATSATAGVEYTITALCDTDATPAETLEAEITVQVE